MAANKRWMTIATPTPCGWQLATSTPVGDVVTLLDRLRAQANGASVALGVDFPIGLPHAYAALHVTEPDFPTFLRALATRPEFFSVGATLADVTPRQPFYPARGLRGMTRASLAAALLLEDVAGLSRRCDRATSSRPAGAPLFWTLGANQTGKAAIAAWRDLLIPALAGSHPPRLWPFEGDFRALLTPGAVAIAETYPADALRQLGLSLRGSKRRQSDRAALTIPLLNTMAQLDVTPTPAMATLIQTGFGADAAGEDRFDSTIGVLCVIAVLAGQRPDSIPDDPALRQWEGWVLGQKEEKEAVLF